METRALTNLRDGLIILLVMAAGSFADGGRTAASFLNIPVGARATGMGGAFVAVSDDATACYWNPAGLATLEGSTASFVHNTWIVDTNCEFACFTARLNPSTAIGVSTTGLIYGSMARQSEPDESGSGSFTANDVAISLSVARKMMPSLALGGTVKAVLRAIEDERSRGLCFDLGLLWRRQDDPGISAGVTIRNVGPGMSLVDAKAPLPVTASIGLSWVKTWSHCDLIVSGDIELPRYESNKVRFGCEVSYGLAALRVGYRRVLSDYADDEALTGPTFGIGVTYRMVGFNISHASLGGPLGSTTSAGVFISL